MKEKKLQVIMDSAGRIIIGKDVTAFEANNSVSLLNPVILHPSVAQNGNISVQQFPVMFGELVDPDSLESNVWTFTNFAYSDVLLDDKVVEMYENVVTPRKVEQPKGKVLSIKDIGQLDKE